MDAKTISVLLVACMFVCMFEGASGATRAELVKLFHVSDDCTNIETRLTNEESKQVAELESKMAKVPELLASNYQSFLDACATCCYGISSRAQANIDNNICYCLLPLSAEAKQLSRQRAAAAA